MEKSYRVVGNTGHWAVAEDGAEPAGDYATREGALEAIYLAASNDIKKGRGVTIRMSLRRRMHRLQVAIGKLQELFHETLKDITSRRRKSCVHAPRWRRPPILKS